MPQVAIEVISNYGKPDSPTGAVSPESSKSVVDSITSAQLLGSNYKDLLKLFRLSRMKMFRVEYHFPPVSSKTPEDLASLQGCTFEKLHQRDYYSYSIAQNFGGENFGKTNVIRQYFTQPNYRFTKVANINSPTFSLPKL